MKKWDSDIENLDIMLGERYSERESKVLIAIRSEDLKVSTVTRLEVTVRTYI